MSIETKNPMVKEPETKPQSELGTRADLGPDASREIAQKLVVTPERLDKSFIYSAENKSDKDIEADIAGFREQIRAGETKDSNGKYNEQLVLENERKLKAAELALAERQREIIKKAAQEQEKIDTEKNIIAVRAEIQTYREQIKAGETKNASGQYNEKLVLESEQKLHEAEKKLAELERPPKEREAQRRAQLEKEMAIAAAKTEIHSYREQIKVGEAKDASGQYNEKMVLESEQKLREAEKKLAALENYQPTSLVEEEGEEEVPAIKTETVAPKKKEPGLMKRFFKKLFPKLYSQE